MWFWNLRSQTSALDLHKELAFSYHNATVSMIARNQMQVYATRRTVVRGRTNLDFLWQRRTLSTQINFSCWLTKMMWPPPGKHSRAKNTPTPADTEALMWPHRNGASGFMCPRWNASRYSRKASGPLKQKRFFRLTQFSQSVIRAMGKQETPQTLRKWRKG